jgi:hypothetical protein
MTVVRPGSGTLVGCCRTGYTTRRQRSCLPGQGYQDGVGKSADSRAAEKYDDVDGLIVLDGSWTIWMHVSQIARTAKYLVVRPRTGQPPRRVHIAVHIRIVRRRGLVRHPFRFNCSSCWSTIVGHNLHRKTMACVEKSNKAKYTEEPSSGWVGFAERGALGFHAQYRKRSAQTLIAGGRE